MAGIRARVKGSHSGVMVTASHNPKQDNGLKIVERDGSMLEHSWEKLAEDLVNAPDLASFLHELATGKHEEAYPGISSHIFPSGKSDSKELVFIGMDTRESSQRLCNALKLGVDLIGGHTYDLGLVSTP